MVAVGILEDIFFEKCYRCRVLLGYGDGVFYGWDQGEDGSNDYG